MTDYVRIGNRSFQTDEVTRLTPKQIEQIKVDGERANQKRLENMRAGLGLEPQKMMIDVTPAGIAARKASIAAEEAKIVKETKVIEEELGPMSPNAIAENETPAETKIMKPKGKKKAVTVASNNTTTL